VDSGWVAYLKTKRIGRLRNMTILLLVICHFSAVISFFSAGDKKTGGINKQIGE